MTEYIDLLEDFIHGRLVSISFLVFFTGLAFQVVRFWLLTAPKERSVAVRNIPPLRQNASAGNSSGRPVAGSRLWKTDRWMAVVTWLFHSLLFLIPVFLLGHNILLELRWGWRIWSIPEFLTDLGTFGFLMLSFYLLFRRLLVPRVRAITTLYDYGILLVASAPFLTGYLAYHQWFDYKTVMTLHVIAGEIMLMAVPFTRLGHMLYFFLYRFLIGSEHSFLRGRRSW
jgi:nitrate reductase gamma subunit